MKKTITNVKYQKLLEWLKSARNEQGLSMRDLAVRLDEPHSFIGKVETAERRLDVREYVEYCQALKLDPQVGILILS